LEARVNPNTMQKALVELEEKGLIYTERTNGKFVADNKELIKFAKQKMANELVDDFIFNMKNLGFDQETILSYLKERMEK
jgi:DNA-binding transcriptional regulator YhcF (GntR family)